MKNLDTITTARLRAGASFVGGMLAMLALIWLGTLASGCASIPQLDSTLCSVPDGEIHQLVERAKAVLADAQAFVVVACAAAQAPQCGNANAAVALAWESFNEADAWRDNACQRPGTFEPRRAAANRQSAEAAYEAAEAALERARGGS